MVALAKSKKAASLVMNAMKELRDPRMLTAKNIADYMSETNNMSENMARRTVQSTLKRGMALGVISKRRNGLYEITDIRSLAKQNRRRRSRSHSRSRRRRSRRRGGRHRGRSRRRSRRRR